MQDSVGRRLTKARLAKGLSIEEVAHATRIRPDKITALECGDYSRFGGNAYAKGFLIIYSKYLKVDASEETRLLESPRTVSVNDYQYLSNNNAPLPADSQVSYRPRSTARPSPMPLFFFIVLVGLAIVVFNFFVTAKRLDNPKDPQPLPSQKFKPGAAAPQTDPPPPSQTPASPAPAPQAPQAAPTQPDPQPVPAQNPNDSRKNAEPGPGNTAGTPNPAEPDRKQPLLQPFQPIKR